MLSDIPDPVPADAPLAALTACLRDPVDAVRAAAAQALGALGTAEVAPALVDALLDEDPDVRVDAMAALARLARPEDAPALRQSLEGDPVGDVKTAAIRGLARLGDRESVPLLRRLARERAENTVAWEDTGDVWDDWLDVQVAAIEALGRMRVAETVEDLLAAQADELGQDLDAPVFAALATIPGAGPDALLDFLRHPDARTRRRAAAAIATLAPEGLRPLVTVLLADRDGAVRALAIPAIAPEEDAARRLCEADPDQEVRRAALEAFAPRRPDLARRALSDPSDACRALGIRALPVPEGPQARDDLRANLAAWLATGGPDTAHAALDRIAEIEGADALTPLAACAEDTERPMELRIAALGHLARIGGAEILAPLERAARDRARQVRMAALVALAGCAEAGAQPVADQAAVLLTAVISGTLLTEREGAPEASPTGAQPPSPGEVRITPEGDIVAATLEEAVRARQSSTLAALMPQEDLSAPHPDDDGEAEIDPLHGGDAAVRKPKAGGRKRISVDGPDDVAGDLRLNALKAVAGCCHPAVAAAIVAATRAEGAELRRAAFEAMAVRAGMGGLPPEDAETTLARGMRDTEAAIRLLAARAIQAGLAAERAAALLRPALEDTSAPVRAVALAGIGDAEPDRLMHAMGAREKPLREAALDGLLAPGCADTLARGIDRAIAAGGSDVLARAARESAAARRHLMEIAGAEHAPAAARRAALRALAGVTA